MSDNANTEKRARLIEKESGLFDWQPGNGTRYYIALTETGRGPLLTWLDRSDIAGTSFLFIDEAREQVGAGYFKNKMRLRHEHDAIALLDFAVDMGLTKGYY